MQIRDRIKELRRVPANELRPSPRNWRTHPDSQKDAIRGVLAEIGFAGAELARELDDGSLELIDGHARAEIVGTATIPVLVLDVDEAEAAKLLVTYDPIGSLAGANEESLAALLADVEMDNEALQKMLDDLGEQHGLGEDEPELDEDEVPEPPEDPITKPGDLWVLKRHRLLCGDSTEADDVDRLMDHKKADLCFTSPPYGQQRDYTAESDCSDWDKLMRNVFGNLPMSDAGQVLVNLGLIHREGEWVPYWDGWIQWMREQGWRRFGWYVWDQGFGLPGDWNGRFGPSHEFVFHFNRMSCIPKKWVDKQPENIKPRNAMESTMRRADGKTVAFTNPGASAQPTKVPDSVIRIGRQVGSDGHPAQFPVALASAFLLSWPGMAYDPFLGSGTTLIAAEQLDRTCYGLEISPAYCDVIVERWQNLTGERAERETAK